MCVKEFLGYMCGHCSMPYLRQCPVTASNPTFPNCKFPAERPIFTNENCHACERVLWNHEVLRKEEEHRQMHKRRECHCEVMFDAEERERRQRPRPSKGKGKGKESARIENRAQDPAEGVAGVAGVATGQEVICQEFDGRSGVAGVAGVVGVVGVVGDYKDAKVHGVASFDEAGSCDIRGSWAPDAQMAAYQYVGYHASAEIGLAPAPQGVEMRSGVDAGIGLVALAQPGYSAGGGVGRLDMNFIAGGNGFPVGGAIPRESLWEGQLELGQPGAGMKWYPQPNEPNIPTVPDFNQPTARTPTKKPVPRVWQRAMSEPLEKFDHSTSPLTNPAEPVAIAVAVAVPIPTTEPQQPAVVSSDMATL